MDQMNESVSKTCGKVRTKINRAVFLQSPGDIDARILFKCRVTNVRICFVVAKQNVEFWLVLLDQVVFERERFLLVVDDDVFQIGDFANERSRLGVLQSFLEEIGANAASQR